MNTSSPLIASQYRAPMPAARLVRSTRVQASAPAREAVHKSWLDRLADWADQHPQHHHMGSYLTGR